MPDVPEKRSVLIGSSGTGNAFSSILALRRHWGSSVRIVAIDTNPRHLVTSSLLSDSFYQVPETCKPEFRKSVAEIYKMEKINTYIPFIDEEIYVAALLYEAGKFDENLVLQVKSSAIADICNDKYKTYLWLSDAGISTPRCFINESGKVRESNLILKPRKGFGTRIIRWSEVDGELWDYDPDKYLLQYECEKPEITIDVCYDRKRGYFNYVCSERLEIKSGVCTKARLFNDYELD